MAIDYRKTAGELVKELGGNENIMNVTHCATRLRFILKEDTGINKEKVAKIPGVITTVEAGGQFQVVIGNHVKDAYLFVMELVTVSEEDAKKGSTQKIGIFSRIVDVISAIFAPFLYTLAACGILQGILGVLVALNAIDTAGGTYQILNFVSWTAFTFLPVMIAVTASKKFGVNTFIAVVIACALVCPDYIAMVNAADPVYFLGFRVQLLSYTSSVIPIILAIWVASYVERFFEKYLPLVVRNLFTPMFTIVIMVPLTLLAFGPVGNAIGGAIGDVYNTLYGLSPIVAGIVVGGFWEVLVIFGVHWGITPVTVGNYANLGYDTFTGLQAAAVFSQAGAALGVFLKTKDKEMKGVSASAAITGLFGITEPAIYGVNLRLKKPMICGCIAGAVGGAIGGAFNAVSWGYNMPGIATLPAYFKAGHATQFLGLLLSILVAFILGAVLTYIVGFKEEKGSKVAVSKETESKETESKETESKETESKEIVLKEIGSKELTTKKSARKDSLIHENDKAIPMNEESKENNIKNENSDRSPANIPGTEFVSPITGIVIPLAAVKDEVFASGALGNGVGIVPEEGKVYAPFDGKAAAVFPTGHAIGLIDPTGTEFLIHIGIDTVKLDGKGFTAYVQQGDHVKKGDLLVEFDIKEIQEAGYDTTVMYIMSNAEQEITISQGRHEALTNAVINTIPASAV